VAQNLGKPDDFVFKNHPKMHFLSKFVENIFCEKVAQTRSCYIPKIAYINFPVTKILPILSPWKPPCRYLQRQRESQPFNKTVMLTPILNFTPRGKL
jgi:hypothetical protein